MKPFQENKNLSVWMTWGSRRQINRILELTKPRIFFVLSYSSCVQVRKKSARGFWKAAGNQYCQYTYESLGEGAPGRRHKIFSPKDFKI